MAKIWMLFWAYVYEVLGLLDRLGDWIGDQVDHNDYLAGAVFVLVLFELAWFLGAIDVIVR